MQGTPSPEDMHQWEAEEGSELSEGEVGATSPDISYLVYVSSGAAFSSVSWMGEESIIQRERALGNQSCSGVQHW